MTWSVDQIDQIVTLAENVRENPASAGEAITALDGLAKSEPDILIDLCKFTILNPPAARKRLLAHLIDKIRRYPDSQNGLEVALFWTKIDPLIVPDVLPILAEALHHRDYWIWRTAARGLADLQLDRGAAKSAIPALTRALYDEDYSRDIRYVAGRILAMIDPNAAEAAIPPLARRAVRASCPPDDFCQELLRTSTAQEALRGIVETDTTFFLKALDHQDPRVRLGVLRSTIRGRAHEFEKHIIRALKDRDFEVRREAVFWLRVNYIAHPHAIAALVQSLADHDPFVRVYAAAALTEARVDEVLTQAIVPTLRQSLQERESEVRRCACHALRRLGPAAREAVPDIIGTPEAEENWNAMHRERISLVLKSLLSGISWAPPGFADYAPVFLLGRCWKSWLQEATNHEYVQEVVRSQLQKKIRPNEILFKEALGEFTRLYWQGRENPILPSEYAERIFSMVWGYSSNAATSVRGWWRRKPRLRRRKGRDPVKESPTVPSAIPDCMQEVHNSPLDLLIAREDAHMVLSTLNSLLTSLEKEFLRRKLTGTFSLRTASREFNISYYSARTIFKSIDNVSKGLMDRVSSPLLVLRLLIEQLQRNSVTSLPPAGDEDSEC